MWKDIELLKKLIGESISKTEVLIKLGLKNNGGNYNTLSHFIAQNNIDTSHFNSRKYIFSKRKHLPNPIEDILVENSKYRSSNHLKNRLYKLNIKNRYCELCNQGEYWNGQKMALILDHINGNRYDNRIENLRIVCPNCNATLDTHCRGLKVKKTEQERTQNRKTKKCNVDYCVNMIRKEHNHCLSCWKKINKSKSQPNNLSFLEHSKSRRIKARPAYNDLISEIESFGYVGTSKLYNVSDNCIRKWKKMYEKYGNDF